ncbi:hypothetical protein SAMN00777080_0278 [Aquiflexum balticum DSM 16537]|uniref:Uncharacterized protein n=1 Tax=Aquiflexum balticum DSM 16537 TaxID=758820 RepID=A0A1W2GZH2_9BACT|nr:hypothetical protein [Aquiflexum balticum]SMD41748.1 hypothetical protein SAMN00777080_0278 [Aquiflexum balticum DSM 16537]
MKALAAPAAQQKAKNNSPTKTDGTAGDSLTFKDNRKQTAIQLSIIQMASESKVASLGFINSNSKKTDQKANPSKKTKAIPFSFSSALIQNKEKEQKISSDKVFQLQKKQVFVTGLSHLVEKKGETIYGGNEKLEVLQGQELEISTNALKSRRGPNQEEYSALDKKGPHHYDWFKVYTVDGKDISDQNLYVRGDVFKSATAEKGSDRLGKTKSVVEAVTKVPATFIGNEGITGLADALNDKTIHTRTSGGPGATVEGKQHAANMGIVGDSITGVTGLLAMAHGFKSLGDPEATAADIFITIIDIEQGAMKTGEAVSKLVHTASGSTLATDASHFGSAFEGFGSAFGGIKEGFEAMRGVVNLINKHQDYSTEEKVQASAEIALHAMESAKSIVLSVKAFIELVNSTGASGHLMAAVPGLDIAISGGKMIMQGYYLAISNNNRRAMNIQRNKIAEALKIDKEDLKEASEFYRCKDAEIANIRQVILQDQSRLKNHELNTGKRFFKEKREVSFLKNRISDLKAKIKVLEAENHASISRSQVEDFTLATELRDANKKRVVRQGIHLATEMAKIAGSIATLTGMGAAGGAAVKGAAAAVDLALPATRMAKQAGRDRMARKIAKGKAVPKKGVFEFDPTKSTAAKVEFRLQQAKFILRKIVNLAYLEEPNLTNEGNVILGYLKAAGVNEKKLIKNMSDPQKQIKILIEGINQREFI